jgi:Glycine rich protein
MLHTVAGVCDVQPMAKDNAIRTILLGLAAMAVPVSACATTIAYSGTIATYTVTSTGIYNITASGAQGGNSATVTTTRGNLTLSLTSAGGLGAVLSGDVSLTAGKTLDFVVGGAGITGNGDFAGGGGGGTFVFFPAATQPLIVAGGGGGGGGFFAVSGPSGPGNEDPGGAGQTNTSGGAACCETGGAGGTAGFGGGGGMSTVFPENGGGGAGWLGNGGNGVGSSSGIGGNGPSSFTGGAGTSGGNGGFGGGGEGSIGGGGGGGYSGGGGGEGDNQAGGGGGSYFDPSFFKTTAAAGANSGSGYVTINELSPAAEPSSILLLGTGLLGFVIVFRRTPPPAGSPSARQNIAA